MVPPLYRTVRIFHLHVERPLGDRLGYRSLSRRDWALGGARSFAEVVTICQMASYTPSQNGRKLHRERSGIGRVCPIPGRARRRAAAVPARKRVLTPHHIKAAKSGIHASCDGSQTKAGQELGDVSIFPLNHVSRGFGTAHGRRSSACSLDFPGGEIVTRRASASWRSSAPGVGRDCLSAARGAPAGRIALSKMSGMRGSSRTRGRTAKRTRRFITRAERRQRSPVDSNESSAES
jgi:hypothetical protein